MSFESLENTNISEAEIIEILDAEGPEDPETEALLERYVDQCRSEIAAKYAGQPDAEASSRTDLETEIKIATLYLQTKKYKDLGREDLKKAREAALQDPTTQDLVEQIDSLNL